MSEINLSSAVRTSLVELQSTADLLSSTQERLATGNRVNSALDDPSAFFTAASLNDRASDLSTLLDAQGQAIQVVEAADQGISAISELVESARAQANSALQSDDASVRAEAAQAFDDILGQIETLAADSSFNGINLLDSENSTDLTVIFNEDNTASLTVQGVNFTDAAAGLGLNRVSATNNSTSVGAASDSSTQVDLTNADAGDTLSFTVGNSNGSTTDFSVTLADVDVPQVDAQTSAANLGALTGATGGVDISIAGGGSIQDLDLSSAAGDADAAAVLINDAAQAAGVDVTATVDSGNIVFSSGTGDITVADNAGTPATLADSTGSGGNDVDFAAASTTTATVQDFASQISAAAEEAGVDLSSTTFGQNVVLSSGTGDVSGSFTDVSDNSNNSTFNSAGGGANDTAFSAGNGGGSNFATTDDINFTLQAIDDALSTLRSTAATLGSDLSTIQIRSDFTEDLINTLEVGAGNLTLADLNEEGANLLTLQTRQTLASTSLSFATQADQSVLSLF